MNCEDPLGIKLSMLETAILFTERGKVTKILQFWYQNSANLKQMVCS